MAPIIKVNDETLKTLNPKVYTLRNDLEIQSNEDNFIYIPSISLYVAKERSLHEKNWFEAHKELQENGKRMLTIPEFVEVLKYTKKNHKDIYNEITEVRSPWRTEWLDADFKLKDNILYINSNHILDKKGSLVPQNSEILDKNTLMKDKTPGVSLENWIENPTKQGLPSKKVKSGDLYYWNPRSDNNSVARFDASPSGAFLICGRGPAGGGADLGVRAAKLRE